jgi:1-acyl-sn-glycerol-3-phosphate acyltransferase
MNSTIANPESDPRDRRRFYFHITPLRRIVVAVLRAGSFFLMDRDVKGLENFSLDGAAIMACNHVTDFDVFPMQFSLPRPMFYMGKADLFQNPIMDRVIWNLGAFPAARDKKDSWAYNHALKILAHGQTLGMFPEGTRSRGRGLGVAKTGAARLAIESNAPIVPMAITGTDRFIQRFPRRARVTGACFRLSGLIPTKRPSPSPTG